MTGNSLCPPARVLPGSPPHTVPPLGQEHLLASVGTRPPLAGGPSYLIPGRSPGLGGPQLCLPRTDPRACQGPRLPGPGLLRREEWQPFRRLFCSGGTGSRSHSSPGQPPARWVTPGRSLWTLRPVPHGLQVGNQGSRGRTPQPGVSRPGQARVPENPLAADTASVHSLDRVCWGSRRQASHSCPTARRHEGVVMARRPHCLGSLLPPPPGPSGHGPLQNGQAAPPGQEAVAEGCWEAAPAEWKMQMVSPIRLERRSVSGGSPTGPSW